MLVKDVTSPISPSAKLPEAITYSLPSNGVPSYTLLTSFDLILISLFVTSSIPNK